MDNAKLGLFVMAGLVFLIFSLYMIGRNRSLFGSTFTISASFSNVNGLVSGNNVRYSGIDVGTVDRIELINDTVVHVSMLLDQDVRQHLRQNAIASIGTDGLMGNKIISIKSQPGDAPIITDGGFIQSRIPVETDAMLQTLNTTNENIATISRNLKEITRKLNSSHSLWTLLSDSLIVTDIKKSVSTIRQAGINTARLTDDASELVIKLTEGKGLASALFTDTVMTHQLKQSLSQIQKASEDLGQTTEQLKKTMDNASRGKGTLGVLFSDTATANQLRQTILNIEQGTDKFNVNMEALQHHFLFRGYFKDKEKKAEKERNKKK